MMNSFFVVVVEDCQTSEREREREEKKEICMQPAKITIINYMQAHLIVAIFSSHTKTRFMCFLSHQICRFLIINLSRSLSLCQQLTTNDVHALRSKNKFQLREKNLIIEF